jgi:pimeloyl-ACP methyl ester carboxylesterase
MTAPGHLRQSPATVRPLPFFSERCRVDADLHLPDDDGAGTPHPVLIAASGYLGLKVLHPERFARALTALGYAVLAFDYRGFGASEGERGRLAPQDWVQDIRAAVDRLLACQQVDPARIGLLGWGLGGGVAVAEAADDPRVRAVAAVNAVADGLRCTRNMHDEESWNRLLARIEADRPRRAALGRSEITSPWDIVRLDLDARTAPYVSEELYRAPGYGSGVTLESADLLLRFSPERVVGRLAGRPLLIVHGEQNELHRPEEAQALYDHAAEPKRLVFLEGVGHTEWMFDEHPTFHRLVGVLDGFFHDAFADHAAHEPVSATKG